MFSGVCAVCSGGAERSREGSQPPRHSMSATEAMLAPAPANLPRPSLQRTKTRSEVDLEASIKAISRAQGARRPSISIGSAFVRRPSFAIPDTMRSGNGDSEEEYRARSLSCASVLSTELGDAVEPSLHETYMYDSEHSLVHLQMRTSNRASFAMIRTCEVTIVVAVGVTLGLLSMASIMCSASLHSLQADLLDQVLSAHRIHHDNSTGRAGPPSEEQGGIGISTHGLLVGWLAYTCFNTLVICSAAVLGTMWPHVAGSGIADVKAYLNGTSVPHIFDVATLIAKTVGAILVVSTSLPLGKEGPVSSAGARARPRTCTHTHTARLHPPDRLAFFSPRPPVPLYHCSRCVASPVQMVHIGAIVASQISSIQLPLTNALFELRLPNSQRLWVGMGTAAGVAAAFQAPIGGILYAFEEVRCRPSSPVASATADARSIHVSPCHHCRHSRAALTS